MSREPAAWTACAYPGTYADARTLPTITAAGGHYCDRHDTQEETPMTALYERPEPVPTPVDWPELLRIAAALRVPVYRPDASGELRRVTTPPRENR